MKTLRDAFKRQGEKLHCFFPVQFFKRSSVVRNFEKFDYWILIFSLSLEEMKLRRTELQAEIESQEEEKNHLQREIEKLSYKLTRLNDSLTKKIAVRNEYDRTITDTETAYVKILESSQLLLNMIKREATNLDQTLVKANMDKQQC
ncbi:microtubule nucleation factor SSNA1-like isoform X1 [Bombus affinis]|uniref:Sjoegren syndrome nuclear autoantigen 1 homolog isoform X1 n=1 Tax=Bombus terrestris TaxID=30195 RepID=A0A9C6SRB7_BOMTE|nr:Sjoegren syndrome nuclear autoantigen 1 homolog isoform X1 [Bombus terrestris]XP_050598342.1 microtubule nucleation factor SSNA1-like isoform X1 [Bombus affinis]